jgi:DNA-binding IclR family transcriptional regulator
MIKNKKLPAQPPMGLIDGLKVLQELSVSPDPVTCSDLSDRLGIEVTKVNRILKTLDYLEIASSASRGMYSPGPGIHVLAAQSMAASGLLKRAIPIIEELREFNLIIALGVLWRDTVTYLFHHSPGAKSIAESISRLPLYPATQSSIGLMLLAMKEPEDVTTLYNSKNIPGFSGLTALLKFLETTRENNFADMVNTSGTHSVAVPVGAPVFAALALSDVKDKKDIPSIIEKLRVCAKRIGDC